MQRMYEAYGDISEFLLVYIREAHPADGNWPTGYAKEKRLTKHTSIGQRCSTAQRFLDDKALTIPTVIDGMDNAVAEAYHAHPDRIFLVRSDGTLAIAGRRGPWGFEPALQQADAWLAEFKRTGVEPASALDDTVDIDHLRTEAIHLYHDKEYAQSLEHAQQLHEHEPDDTSNAYLIARLECLLDHHDAAFEWLDKAVASGFRNADYLAVDEDFSDIRRQPRFERLIATLRERLNAVRRSATAPIAPDRAIGEWQVTIDFGGEQETATLMLRTVEGYLEGTWHSDERTSMLIAPEFDGRTLTFSRMMGVRETPFEGQVSADHLEGAFKGMLGEYHATGTRTARG